MSILRFAFVTILVAIAAPAAADDDAPYPPRTIVLFVADWCAPCHAEIARLPAIVAAARPWRVLVADAGSWPKQGRLTRSVAADHRWTLDAATAGRLRRGLLADVAGLPYSAAFDATGRLCAEQRGGMTAARAAAMRAACTSP